MPSVHSILGPSGSKQWLNCPPSALLQNKIPDEGSEYAEKGTQAHAMAEAKIKHWMKTGKKLKVTAKFMAKYPLADEVTDKLTSAYADYVIETFLEEKKNCPDAKLMIEQHLDYSRWVPNGFGTGDACIVSDETLHVIDYKNGVGVLVEAEDNPQLKLYAAGAIAKWGEEYLFDKVVVHIFQLAKDNIATDEFTVQEIEDWMESYVKPRAALAAAGKGEFKAGDHCKWCRLKPNCQAYNKLHMDALEDFRNDDGVLKRPGSMPPEEAARIFPQLKAIKSWAEDLEAWCLDQALEGVKFPGLKLVEGRSNRCFTDPEAVMETLLQAGYEQDELYQPRKAKTLTQLEKQLKSEKFEKLLGKYVTKPAGKPALVVESDKRPALDMVMNDFADE